MFRSDYREFVEGSEFEQNGQFQTVVFDNTLVVPTGQSGVQSNNGRFYEVATVVKDNATGI